jgi:hypothetical protein
VLGYVLGCTALAVAPGERCLVTDHRLLQLSWTRDAYYQALLLLAARHLEPRALPVVAEHLRWLWFRCDRAAGWMRSHLPNGAVKDRAFQADQQLYPVLELLDYREAAGGWPEATPGRADWGEVIGETWRALPVDPELGLLAGDLDRTWPDAAASLREGMAETLTLMRLGITGQLAKTLCSTNPCESMIEIVRYTQRNVKRWQEGDMRRRWTAAGMLVAEQQFRRIIGYRDLAKLVIAIERHAILAARPNPNRIEVADPVTV